MHEHLRRILIVVGLLLVLVPLGAGVYIGAASHTTLPIPHLFYFLEETALYPMSLGFLLVAGAFIFKIENVWAVRIADLSLLLSIFINGYFLITSLMDLMYRPYLPLWMFLSIAASWGIRLYNLRKKLHEPH